MKMQVALLLGLLAISVDAASRPHEPSIFKTDDLFLLSDPNSQIRYVMYNDLAWFEEQFRWIKESGMDLNTKFANGDTLLHIAVKEGAVDMVKALIAAGADVDKTDKCDTTAVQLACCLADGDNQFIEVWRLLKDAGKLSENDEEEGEEEMEESKGEERDDESVFDESESANMDVVEPRLSASESSPNTLATSSKSISTVHSIFYESYLMNAPMYEDIGVNLDIDPENLNRIFADSEESVSGAAMNVAPASETVASATSSTSPNGPLPIPGRYWPPIPLMAQVHPYDLNMGINYTVI